MVDFWNFKDFMAVAGHYWPWMLAAALWGALLGWYACASGRNTLPEFRNDHEV